METIFTDGPSGCREIRKGSAFPSVSPLPSALLAHLPISLVHTLARCPSSLHQISAAKLRKTKLGLLCRGICFQFSPRADSARRVPQTRAEVGAARHCGAARPKGADSPACLGGRTCRLTSTRSHLVSRAGSMRPRAGEPGAVSYGMPAIWIYSDTDTANCSQRNPVDSKNDKVEFIRSRFMCSAER